MSGLPRNADKLNNFGIVVIGLCGAVLTYVSIVLLQAYYADSSADVQTMADYGGQDTDFKTLRASQLGQVSEYRSVTGKAGQEPTYALPIERAMELVVEDGKDPAMLVPSQGRADKATTTPPGAPAAAPAAVPVTGGAEAGSGSGSGAPADGAGSAAGSGAGAGSGSGSAAAPAAPAAGSGSAAVHGP
jgi:hypothetical protein